MQSSDASFGDMGINGARKITAVGVSRERVALLVAVVERAGVELIGDVVVSIADGADASDTALDVAIVGAPVSAARGRALPPRAVCIGEVGLGCELRGGKNIEARLALTERLGLVVVRSRGASLVAAIEALL